MNSELIEMLRNVAGLAQGEKTKRLAGPYIVKAPDERTYAVATDGKVIVWIETFDSGSGLRILMNIGEEAQTKKKLLMFFAPPHLSPAWKGRLGSLRSFCGDAEWSVPCPECKGISKASEYVHCAFCDGDGEMFPETRRGIVCGVAVNRLYLANILAVFPGTTPIEIITNNKDGGEVWIISGTFRIALMSMRIFPDSVVQPEWDNAPKFPATEAIAT